MDTTILLAGALTVGAYFDKDTAVEREVRTLAEQLYRRVDWHWARNGGVTVAHGWTPERGFLRNRWEGYNEGLLLYVLGLGSPTLRTAAARRTSSKPVRSGIRSDSRDMVSICGVLPPATGQDQPRAG